MALALETPLRELPGIGETRSRALERLGLRTVGDLLHHYPRDYEDRTVRSTFRSAPEGEAVCVAAMVAETAMERFGSIDILVNNAGITKDNLIMKMSEEEFDKVIEVNLKGAFNCMKHVSRIMLKQRTGHIINMSSVSGPDRTCRRPECRCGSWWR